MLKYVVPGYPMPTLYFGIANVLANALVMVRYVAVHFIPLFKLVLMRNSSVVLWVAQNMEDEYTYNLAL